MSSCIFSWHSEALAYFLVKKIWMDFILVRIHANAYRFFQVKNSIKLHKWFDQHMDTKMSVSFRPYEWITEWLFMFRPVQPGEGRGYLPRQRTPLLLWRCGQQVSPLLLRGLRRQHQQLRDGGGLHQHLRRAHGSAAARHPATRSVSLCLCPLGLYLEYFNSTFIFANFYLSKRKLVIRKVAEKYKCQ